jgi:hypothetical protein
MEDAGEQLVIAGHTIVSGNAPGADQAWARGGKKVDPSKVELWLPWDYFEERAIVQGNLVKVPAALDPSTQQAELMCRETHPIWSQLSLAVKKFHIRNVFIVQSAKRCLYWMDSTRVGGGGSGFTLSVAQKFHVTSLDVSSVSVRDGFDGAAINGPIFP